MLVSLQRKNISGSRLIDMDNSNFMQLCSPVGYLRLVHHQVQWCQLSEQTSQAVVGAGWRFVLSTSFPFHTSLYTQLIYAANPSFSQNFLANLFDSRTRVSIRRIPFSTNHVINFSTNCCPIPRSLHSAATPGSSILPYSLLAKHGRLRVISPRTNPTFLPPTTTIENPRSSRFSFKNY